jgi:large repetitive protein
VKSFRASSLLLAGLTLAGGSLESTATPITYSVTTYAWNVTVGGTKWTDCDIWGTFCWLTITANADTNNVVPIPAGAGANGVMNTKLTNITVNLWDFTTNVQQSYVLSPDAKVFFSADQTNNGVGFGSDLVAADGTPYGPTYPLGIYAAANNAFDTYDLKSSAGIQGYSNFCPTGFAACLAPPLPTTTPGVSLGFGVPGPAYAYFSANLYAPPYVWTGTGPLNVPRYQHTATLLQDGTVLVAAGSYAPYIQNSAEIYDPVSNTFTATPLMSTPRTLHTATLLANGKVLLAGGGTNTVEWYDPVARAFSAAAPMAASRSGHTATRLADGRVLVVGGDGGGNTAELYDPAADLWTAAAAAHNDPGVVGTATLLADGRVLTIANAAAEIYDPAANAWTPVTPVPGGRTGHTATLLPSGKVLVAGGATVATTSAPAGHADTALYDPATDTWTTIAGGPFGSHGTATLLPSGKVLFDGGVDTVGSIAAQPMLFDPATGAWTTFLSQSIDMRAYHTSTLLPNGRVLIVGGSPDGGGLDILGTGLLYDPASDLLAPGPSLLQAREGHTATPLANGQILVVGGQNGSGLSSAELYDPATSGFGATGSLAYARSRHAATLLPSGGVLVTGGDDGIGGQVGNAELYDTASGAFTAAGSFAIARSGHTTTLLGNGQVLAVGGHNALLGYPATTETYDPTANSWLPGAPLTVPRDGHTATLLADGRLLVTGGQALVGGQPGYTDVTEVYDPVARAWTQVAPAPTLRAQAAAVLLPSGKVLVTGGLGPAGYSAEIDLYDPAADTWTILPSLRQPRASHTATLLPSGHVLIAGGVNAGGDLDDADLFDPVSAQVGTAWTIGDVRGNHSATLLPNGKVLLAGGESSPGAAIGTTALFSHDLGISDAQRPVVNPPASVALGAPLVLSGSGFTGTGEASGGNDGQSSPTNHPVATLQSIASGQSKALGTRPGAPWSAASLTTQPVVGLPSGPARLTVSVNGVPSLASTVVVTPPAVSVALSADTTSIAWGGTIQFSATVTGVAPTGTVQFFDGTTALGSALAVPPNGTVTLSVTSPAVGAHAVVASYSGDAINPAKSSAPVSVTIVQASQTIAFGAAPVVVVGGTGTVSARATSGLSVVFSSTTPAVCTIAGATVAGVAAGTCTIAANQAGDANYAAAPQVTQSFVVASGGPTVTLAPGTLAFPATKVGRTSATQTARLSNAGTRAILVGSIRTTGDFVVHGTTCPILDS